MKLRVTIVQFDIVWENKKQNLDKVENLIATLKDKTDLIVLPEMFSTGFSMNAANLAEEVTGETISRVNLWAKKLDCAICGSFIAKDGSHFYNRGFFISPEKSEFYDKRHLFRMGEEANYFSAGKEHLIVEHKGFNICLLICYDLRFPVWSRNIDLRYDLLIYPANWPVARIKAWQALLVARAIENMSFVCGVNRIGKDGYGTEHNGCSALIDAKGNVVSDIKNNEEQIETIEISKEELNMFREKFPVWKDADSFEIKY